MVDLAKSIEKEKKISVKMLKDVGELLSLTLSQAQNRQQLSGLTKFRRIDVTPSLDPLDGYLACARCSSTGALVLTEPVSAIAGHYENNPEILTLIEHPGNWQTNLTPGKTWRLPLPVMFRSRVRFKSATSLHVESKEPTPPRSSTHETHESSSSGEGSGAGEEEAVEEVEKEEEEPEVEDPTRTKIVIEHW